MFDHPLQNFTFLQCVIIYRHLETQVGKHDTWLKDNNQKKRWTVAQGPAEAYKGWFFWMFLHRLNSNEMRKSFNSQEWYGGSQRSEYVPQPALVDTIADMK
jgi:hypothetical protein